MNEAHVRLLPIDRIRVVNPRVRDPQAFQVVVDSIAGLGLKKSITVTRRAPNGNGNGNGAEEYDLVCGQGRLEAYVALGAREIPALICDFSQSAGLLASLVENIARRRVRPLDQIKLIQWMKAQGDSAAEIARKTGLSTDYLRHVLALLERGEERLLEGVLQRRAIEQGVTPEAIAKALDVDLKQVMGKVNLLDGIHADAVNLLKDRPITATALRLCRRVKPARQLEMAQLMVASDNYSNAYAQALLVGTPADQLTGKKPTRLTRGLTPEEVARLEKEMESLETELRAHQDHFGENSLRLNPRSATSSGSWRTRR